MFCSAQSVKLSIFVTSGFVAFVVGGSGHRAVELYSPDGGCQYILSPIPSSVPEFYEPVLAFTDEKILACAGNEPDKNCYLYHPNNDSWSVFSTSTFPHDRQPGEVYNDKIFINDDDHPEVFDPATNTWSSWASPLIKNGLGSCLVAWKDTFILLGGFSNRRGVQTFNHSSNTWQVLDSTAVPLNIFLSGCALLPSDEILVVGSEQSIYKSSAVLYNIQANSWKELPGTTNDREGASLVILGSRTFVMEDHFKNSVEELDYNTSSWSLVAAKLMIHREGHQGVIPLPAEMFQHLPGGCVGVQ